MKRILIAVAMLGAAFVTTAARASAADDATSDDRSADVAQVRDALARMTAKSARLDVLLVPYGADRQASDARLAKAVDAAGGSTDPVLLMLLQVRCTTRSAICRSRDFAERWVQAETQNQVAWLALASTQTDDEALSRRTFARAAQASLWNDHVQDLEREALNALPPGLSPRVRLAVLATAWTSALSVAPFDVDAQLMRGCRTEDLAAACHAILNVASRDARDLMTAMLVARASEVSRVDALIVRQRWRTFDVATKGLTAARRKLVVADSLDTMPEPEAERQFADLARIARLGELAFATEAFAASGQSADAVVTDAMQARLERDTRERAARARPPAANKD